MAEELQVLVAVSLGFILFIVSLYLLFFKRKVDVDDSENKEISETKSKEELSKDTFLKRKLPPQRRKSKFLLLKIME